MLVKAEQVQLTTSHNDEIVDFCIFSNDYFALTVQPAFQVSQYGNYEAFWSLVFACEILEEEVKDLSLAVQHALSQLLLQVFR